MHRASPEPRFHKAQRTLRAAAFACVLLLSVAPLSAPNAGSATVQRCRAADGNTVYTDKPCRIVGARALPMSRMLSRRLLDEQLREESLAAVDAGGRLVPTGLYADASLPAAIPRAPGRRAVASGCARTPAQLAADLRGAMALGDVNRIAESYHWVGVSHRSAMRVMERLARMARQPVSNAHYYDARIVSGNASWDDAGAGLGGSGGVLQLSFDGAMGLADFDVERYRGCYFVRF